MGPAMLPCLVPRLLCHGLHVGDPLYLHVRFLCGTLISQKRLLVLSCWAARDTLVTAVTRAPSVSRFLLSHCVHHGLMGRGLSSLGQSLSHWG